ncbi:MAG: hybrid sensor histidine kinase/response regulator [Planctomyces sp.]|nr:hybrid sensor histidine kinase/response regulator [Planctomyces sp.]
MPSATSPALPDNGLVSGIGPDLDERILVLMPTTRDGERTCDALAAAGMSGLVCQDLDDLCRKMSAGGAVALLTEESISGKRGEPLVNVLRQQPAWSDFPLVILARERALPRPETFDERMNVTLVERPLRIRSLISVIRSAMRSRKHQYSVRGHIAQRERHAEELRTGEARLRFVLEAAKVGAWDLDTSTLALDASGICKSTFGRAPDGPFSYADFLEAIHPDDRDRVNTAVQLTLRTGVDYDIEYRAVWPNGSIHWVLARGRLAGDSETATKLSGITLDVTRVKEAEEHLREVDRRKDEFLATLAHELRNPLAPIRNGLQVLRFSNELGPDSKELRELMERQVDHLVRLVDDLMEVSRISRGKIELRREVVAFSGIVSSAIEISRPLLDQAGHDLTVDLPDKEVMVFADRVRLSQVIGNLLTNAAKYTEAGGRIRLKAVVVGEQVVITVHDTGLGIPTEMLPAVFEIYTQMHHTREHSQGGLGIGLALARSLVEMHDGAIEAASDGLGKGSTFTIRLPLALPVVDETPLSDGLEIGNRLQMSSPHTESYEVETDALPELNILLLDDTRSALFVLEKLLKAMGQRVRATQDANLALEWARREKPDLIISDIGMPEIDGYEFARRLRSVPELEYVRLVALTGYGQGSDRERAKAAGFDHHLVKPVALGDLQHLVGTFRPPVSSPFRVGGGRDPSPS